MGYQWISQYLSNSTKFAIFTDDDCFVSVVNTYDYFSHLPVDKVEDGIHCGYVYSTKEGRME